MKILDLESAEQLTKADLGNENKKSSQTRGFFSGSPTGNRPIPEKKG